MTMLAEAVDAVIGIDTHRDSHEVEIADTAGKPIATMQVSNDNAGFAAAAVAEVVPGPRVAIFIEGIRSYGIGLARAYIALGVASKVVNADSVVRWLHRRGRGL